MFWHENDIIGTSHYIYSVHRDMHCSRNTQLHAYDERHLPQLGNGLSKIHIHLMYVKRKGKASSLDIAPLTILDSGALQPPKWQLTGIDCSTAMQASGCP